MNDSVRILLVLAAALPSCAHTTASAGATASDVLTDEPRVTSTLARVDIVCPWEVVNTGTAALRVDVINWTAALDGASAASGEEPVGIELAPGASLSRSLSLSIPLMQEAELAAAREARAALGYEVTGTFRLDGGNAAQRFIATWRGELPPPRRPVLSAELLASRNDDAMELRLLLRVQNGNPFTLAITRLTYILRVDDAEIQRGEVARGDIVPSACERLYEVTDLDEQAVRAIGEKLAAAAGDAQGLTFTAELALTTAETTFSVPIAGKVQLPR